MFTISLKEETLNFLKCFNIEYKVEPSIPYTSNTESDTENDTVRWKYTFDKLNIFKLTEYEKIVYLDTDILILKNIDHLFQLEPITLASDMPYNIDTYNSGVMVVKPNIEDFNHLKEIVNDYEQKRVNHVGNQNVINDYFKNPHVLDENYNIMRIISQETKLFYDELSNTYIPKHPVCHMNRLAENPTIIHYIVQPKPFFLAHPIADEYYHIYQKYLKTVRTKKKKEIMKDSQLLVIIIGNEEPNHLKECLSHISQQTYPNKKVVVITTNETVKRQAEAIKDINITIYSSDQEITEEEMNAAKYISILNSKMILTKDTYELCIKHILDNQLDWCQFASDQDASSYVMDYVDTQENIENQYAEGKITKGIGDKVFKKELLAKTLNLEEILKFSNRVGYIGKNCYQVKENKN